MKQIKLEGVQRKHKMESGFVHLQGWKLIFSAKKEL